jgi:hypothetical protein
MAAVAVAVADAVDGDEGRKFRLNQTIVILKKLRDDLQLPYESPEIQAIKAQMGEFVRTGAPWEGVLSLAPWGREAHLRMTRAGRIELTLRVIGKRKQVQ